jgi:glycogen debranching enzyme
MGARRRARSRRARSRVTPTTRDCAPLVSGELAADQERKAKELRERFNRDFWDDELGFYVLALDGQKHPVGAVASNAGHLLWSGIVPKNRARAVADRLLRDDLFSGWGIRCLSSEMRGYNPLEYHAGTVWPHDSAICAEGMRRYGLREHAGRVCAAVLDAAVAFEHRLPEVFAGFARDGTNIPVPYPDALAPQSWSAGAPLLALRTLLGLDIVDGEFCPAVRAKVARADPTEGHPVPWSSRQFNLVI